MHVTEPVNQDLSRSASLPPTLEGDFVLLARVGLVRSSGRSPALGAGNALMRTDDRLAPCASRLLRRFSRGRSTLPRRLDRGRLGGPWRALAHPFWLKGRRGVRTFSTWPRHRPRSEFRSGTGPKGGQHLLIRLRFLIRENLHPGHKQLGRHVCRLARVKAHPIGLPKRRFSLGVVGN